MRLLLVRHGESVCGANGIVGGEKGCTGLTERGFAQTRALRDRFDREGFKPDVMLASTLPRAIQTAEVLAEPWSLEIAKDPDLCELLMGEADGDTWDEWRERYGFDVASEPGRLFAPGGESVALFRTRVEGLLERLTAEHEGRTVVAACHGGIVYMSMRVLFGITLHTPMPADVDNTSITEWHLREAGWHLVRFNDVAHLHGTELLVEQGA